MAVCGASNCKKRNQCSKYCLNTSQSYYHQFLDYSTLGGGSSEGEHTYMCGDVTQGYENPYPLFQECISSVKHTTPYTLGDTLYEASRHGVEKYTVSSMTLKSNGTWKIRLTSVAHRHVFEIDESEVGRRYFTAEEDVKKSNEN